MGSEATDYDTLGIGFTMPLDWYVNRNKYEMRHGLLLLIANLSSHLLS